MAYHMNESVHCMWQKKMLMELSLEIYFHQIAIFAVLLEIKCIVDSFVAGSFFLIRTVSIIINQSYADI